MGATEAETRRGRKAASEHGWVDRSGGAMDGIPGRRSPRNPDRDQAELAHRRHVQLPARWRGSPEQPTLGWLPPSRPAGGGDAHGCREPAGVRSRRSMTAGQSRRARRSKWTARPGRRDAPSGWAGSAQYPSRRKCAKVGSGGARSFYLRSMWTREWRASLLPRGSSTSKTSSRSSPRNYRRSASSSTGADRPSSSGIPRRTVAHWHWRVRPVC